MFAPPPDTGYIPPPIIPPSLSRVVQNLRGWEPGVEIGVRLIPASAVFIDVGGWVVAVGVGW